VMVKPNTAASGGYGDVPSGRERALLSTKVTRDRQAWLIRC